MWSKGNRCGQRGKECGLDMWGNQGGKVNRCG